MTITKEHLFDTNLQKIVFDIRTEWWSKIQYDLKNSPAEYPDLITWMELHPEIVGKAFMDHIINFGITNEDID